jgi:hypothetical protein
MDDRPEEKKVQWADRHGLEGTRVVKSDEQVLGG